MKPNENTVDVYFKFSVSDKETGDVEEFEETHAMRYLFMPEIEMMLENSGFELLEQWAWMSEQPLGPDTWNGVCSARQKKSR